jgi:hypothetical protein
MDGPDKPGHDELEDSGVTVAGTELSFSQSVPKALGAVSITLWHPLQD